MGTTGHKYQRVPLSDTDSTGDMRYRWICCQVVLCIFIALYKKVKRKRDGRVTRLDFRECLTIISSYFRENKCVKFLREFVRGSGHQYTELRSVITERENNEELSFTFCQTELEANWQLVSKWYLDDNLPNNQAVKKALKDGRKSLVQSLVLEMENKLYILLCDFCKLESLQFVLSSGEMKEYVAGCVKLSLMMNANDPPVAIDCPGWVPCISQKESIYQPKHEEESDLHKQEVNAQIPSNVGGDGSNQNSTLDLKDRLDFNKELFKEYTVRGKYVKFFVWPVMYLHKNGPVLAKGIAQGDEDKMISDDDHRWVWWKTSDSL
ncbi:hypothetical protein MAR_022484 [Mya arenaria]|uniref:Mitochondria-eating protein C-terminal domain-containing protein n=1 Tax=Mya arenaria TaxID=6604 RepID=A0ABY7DMC9_MYAAR|nr:hypothetical protein MAR_022484 [Mya arenaria]